MAIFLATETLNVGSGVVVFFPVYSGLEESRDTLEVLESYIGVEGEFV